MHPLSAVLFFAGMASLFIGFRCFDQLVKYEHEFAFQAWDVDGSPRGFFWGPPGSGSLDGIGARSRVSTIWLFVTPSWAVSSQECRTSLKRYRFCIFTLWGVWLFAVIAGFAFRPIP